MLQLSFPGFRILALETTASGTRVVMELKGRAKRCPNCRAKSKRVHSRYVRRPRDLPILGQPVELHVVVRRFRCGNRRCRRRTFSEPLGSLAAPRAQRTGRMTALLRSIVLKLSSRSGTRLASEIGLRTSPRTLLRTVEDINHVPTTPRVVGVDEFALRRGHTYATLLCDLERGRPIDVLPGREAAELAEWLRRHPSVEVIARDRASAYAQAAAIAAPQAVQVADRFHLVRNVTEALKEVVDRQAWRLPRPALHPDQPVDTAPSEAASSPYRSPRQQEQMAASARRRQQRWEEIQRLQADGLSLRAICRVTGLSRQTVRQYAQSPNVPARAPRRPVPRKLDPFVGYLRDQWEAGRRNARQLFTELVAQGYSGSPSQLRLFLAGWRAQGSQPNATGPRGPVWKEVRWYILCPREHLTAKQAEELAAVLELNSALAVAYNLVQEFRHMVHERRSSDLSGWLEAASKSGHSAFQRLARSLTADRAAVQASLDLPWSTGPVEGHITRVKLLKRIAYGKAGLALLRARILATS